MLLPSSFRSFLPRAALAPDVAFRTSRRGAENREGEPGEQWRTLLRLYEWARPSCALSRSPGLSALRKAVR
eukprot:5709149-Prymnesium_polylepis.1